MLEFFFFLSVNECTGLLILASSLLLIFFFTNQVEVKPATESRRDLIEPFSSSGTPPTFKTHSELWAPRKSDNIITVLFYFLILFCNENGHFFLFLGLNVHALFTLSVLLYTCFFENPATKTCQSPALIGDLTPLRTGKVKSHLKKKLLNTRASI